MKKAIIIGATSAIANAVTKLFVKDKMSLFLLARDQEKLDRISDDLKVRGADIKGHSNFDANDFDSVIPLLDDAIKKLNGVDIVLIAHGSLSDQKAFEKEFKKTLQEFKINALSVMAITSHIANVFEAQKSGTIAVIGSVAGDVGRQSNYIYGSAKGSVDLFLQGLRARLF